MYVYMQIYRYICIYVRWRGVRERSWRGSWTRTWGGAGGGN